MQTEAATALLDSMGAEWREWIVRNLQRGCTPQSMLDSMIKSVWDIERACGALDEGLALLGMPGDWRAKTPVIVPDVLEIQAADRRIKVLSRIDRPRAVLLGDVLSAEECDALIELASAKGLRRSGVVDFHSGESVEHTARTSSSVCFTRAEHPLLDMLETRLASVSSWPLECAEGIQVLRYEPGQEYKPHHDWFDPAKPGAARHLSRGGQRVGTFVVYLAVPEAGGGTRFPKAGVEVFPPRGGAIFFADVDPLGRPDEMTLHAGSPVIRGTKIVATYWQREAAFR